MAIDMVTEHPTSSIFFVFAFTFCEIKVYNTDKEFLLKVLNLLHKNQKIELLERHEGSAQVVDTRLLSHLFALAAEIIGKDLADAHRSLEKVLVPDLP